MNTIVVDKRKREGHHEVGCLGHCQGDKLLTGKTHTVHYSEGSIKLGLSSRTHQT